MNILLYDMSSYIQNDLIFFLTRAGHHCKNIYYKMRNVHEDDFFERKFGKYIQEGNYDCVMSTNFFPILAKMCYENNIKYLAWSYDSPIDSSQISDFQYPTSFIFLFDRIETESIVARGGINVFHLPLAVNSSRLNAIRVSSKQHELFDSEISFVGQFYTNQLNLIRSYLDDYTKGYLDAIVQTQIQVFGCNYISEMVNESFVNQINQGISSFTSDKLTDKQITNAIACQVTHLERTTLCNLLGTTHQLKYYSLDNFSKTLPHITWMGSAKYHTEMPLIFKCSKLNLNPTLKSIQSGIPLRALDIMGCGGVVLSNYQIELAEYFTDGENIIMYDSIEDALAKADYYLARPSLLEDISKNSKKIIESSFSYPNRIETMFKIAELT